ncbi:MAG TPA: carbohydrate ABC transporter permease [Candidatus Kapabacteria bacterium]|jgi:multiple sugar transport system permease protein|nr:carbohydrate ABC transporter permease [Candidatus Kapabacteria bacterium]
MQNSSYRQTILSIIINAILIIIALIMIFPMFWMLLLSLKTYPERFTTFFQTLFSDFSLKNYFEAIQSDNFGLYFINSSIVAICTTAANVLFSTMVGYALARRKFFGKALLTGSILGVLIIPSHVIMIPLYRLIVKIGWLNTYWALIIPWCVTPFGIFLVWQYIRSIPVELEDSARIDGAGFWQIFFKIIFPTAKPVLIVLAIYTFLTNWNSFLFPFLFTNSEQYRTLPVGLTFYLGKQSIDWGHLMAGASLSAIPILILFLIFQKQIIRGLLAGALKE